MTRRPPCSCRILLQQRANSAAPPTTCRDDGQMAAAAGMRQGIFEEASPRWVAPPGRVSHPPGKC